MLRAYCLPTLAAQSAQEFSWVLLCDELTDPESLAELARSLEEIPQARIVLTTPTRPFLGALLDLLGGDEEILITTRLDSDDGLGRSYVERVEGYVEAFRSSDLPAQLLCFPQGCKLETTTGLAYDSYQPNSPIITLFERLSPEHLPITVYAGNHRFLNHRFPLHYDVAQWPWLLVVHEANVNNQVTTGDFPLPGPRIDEHFALRPALVSGRPAVPAAHPKDRHALAEFRANLETLATGRMDSC